MKNSRIATALNYLKFFSSYLLVALIFKVIAAATESTYQELIFLIMGGGLAAMIFTLYSINRKNEITRSNSFFYVHLIWTSVISITGILLELIGAFSSESKFINQDGTETYMISDTVYNHIYVFLMHAIIFSTFILLVCSIRNKNLKQILVVTGSFIIFFIFLVVVI